MRERGSEKQRCGFFFEAKARAVGTRKPFDTQVFIAPVLKGVK